MEVNRPVRTCDLDALVLAGGESRRMGSHKAFLPLGSTTVMDSVLDVLRPMFRRVLVVVRENGTLVIPGVEVLADDRPERGPLVGLARGLAASDAPWCFVVGCDMPFLRPQVIEAMAERLGECDILALSLEGWLQPLHAFYSPRCLTAAVELLDNGVTSIRALFRRCKLETVTAADLAEVDPGLLSFRDLDTREEYRTAQRLVE